MPPLGGLLRPHLRALTPDRGQGLERALIEVGEVDRADAPADAVEADDTITALTAELKSVNEALWEIEDDIRDEERNKRFGDRFIELARAVYVTNDQRADAKKKVNLHLNSTIVEEKSYQDYT